MAIVSHAMTIVLNLALGLDQLHVMPANQEHIMLLLTLVSLENVDHVM